MRRIFSRLIGNTGLVLLSLASASCVVSTTRRQPIVEDDGLQHRPNQGTAIHYDHGSDSPEISRSVGAPGGVVVLWPRIVPRTEDPAINELATRVQARLERIAGKVSSSVDRRPAPERVCPKGEGCRAASLGAVVTMKDKGCAVVAVIGPPGTKDERLVPLAGTVTFTSDTVRFREPPESNVTVQEFVPCEKLLKDLDQNAALEGEEKTQQALEAAHQAPK